MMLSIRRSTVFASLAFCAPGCVWDDQGPRLQEPCQAELDRCIDVCVDRDGQRANVDLSHTLDDPFTCEPRCYQRFERCVDDRAPEDDEKDAPNPLD